MATGEDELCFVVGNAATLAWRRCPEGAPLERQKMVQPGGVEPPTYRAVVWRSIQLSYGCTVLPCGGGIVGQAVARVQPPYSMRPVVGELAEA